MYKKIIHFIKFFLIKNGNKIHNLYIAFLQVFLHKKLSPKAIYIEPTNICNANCIFCAYQFYGAKKKVMNHEVLVKVLEESKKMEVKNINLTPFAGEIFTDKSIIDKLELIKKYSFKNISTYSNLIEIHKVDIRSFLNSGITDFYISTSPLREDLYEKIYRSKKYSRFLDNLEMFLIAFNTIEEKTIKKVSIEFRSNMSLEDCINLEDYKKRIEPLITKNITVSAMTIFDSWMGVISQDNLLDGMKIAKQNGKKISPCSRLNNVQVLSNGDMRVCGCRFNNESDKDIFLIGNIQDISIIDAYNSSYVYKIKKDFILGNPPTECQKCSWYS